MGNCFSNFKANTCCRKNDTTVATQNDCVKCTNNPIQLSLTLNVINNNIQTLNIPKECFTETCHSNLFRTISESKWTVEEMNHLENELQQQMITLKPIDTCKSELNDNEKVETLEKPSHLRTKSLICEENINTLKPEDMQKLTLEYQNALKSLLPEYENSGSDQSSFLDRDETTLSTHGIKDDIVQDNVNHIRKKSLIRDQSLEEWTNEDVDLLTYQYQQELKLLQAGQNSSYNNITKNETDMENDRRNSQSTCHHKRQRSLIRDSSLNEWTTEEVDELADEMISQVKKLKQENSQRTNSTTDQNDNNVGGETSRCN